MAAQAAAAERAVGMVPKFDGFKTTNVMMWLEDARDACDLAGLINEKSQVKVCKLAMTGSARKFIAEQDLPETWAAFKELMSSRFADNKSPTQKLMELMSFRQLQQMSVDAYVTNFQARVAELGLPAGETTDVVKTAAFLHGLASTRLAAYILKDEPKDLAAAMKMATVMGTTFAAPKSARPQPSRGSYQGTTGSSTSKGSDRKLVCYGCGEEGHMKRNCPSAIHKKINPILAETQAPSGAEDVHSAWANLESGNGQGTW